MAQDDSALTAELFLYGFPLVFNIQQIDRFTRSGMGSLAPAPFNTWSHATKLAGPEDTFVSINNDTVYSIAMLDLGVGPLRLDVPDAADRYYVLQFVDAWTNNFAYIGRRPTGTAAGSYWIVPPGHDGDLPPADGAIRAPTRIVAIVGRWAVDGDADLPAVRSLQQQLTLTPLDEAATPQGIPEPASHMPDDMRFLDELRTWSQAFPAAPRDREYEARFAALHDAGEATLRAGLQAGKAKLEAAITLSDGPQSNGWSLTFHIFDYNDDFFELGAIDDPHWKIADRAAARVTRAAAARAGLWGNHGYEAAYSMIYKDADGEQLTGEHRYEITFTRPPPVDAFWSITMYDLPEFFLVANPIERYSIGDRTPGLRHAGDGSLTIVMQRNDPGGDESANWLPTPPGDFRPILRMYQPRDAVFDSGFELPPITRRD